MTDAEPTETTRVLVSAPSPTRPRAPHGAAPCRGVYHRGPGTRPTTALIATHYEADFSEHYLAAFAAARGYGFLGWNTRFAGDGHRFILEHALVDIGVGVRWLRETAGVENVVLLGNSGGASLMSAYQSQALEPNLVPTPWGELPAAVLDLPQADALVVLCAHPGRPDVLTAWLDPAVTDETDPLSLDPSLDMFDPANGPPYSPEIRRALPRCPARTQRADHELGLRGTRTVGGERWIGAGVPRVPHVGRSPLSRPQPRSVTPATRLLRRRRANRELHGSGSCRRVHAAVVAFDVESVHVAMPGAAAPRAHSQPDPRDRSNRRPRVLPERRRADLRRSRIDRQAACGGHR